MEGVGNNHLNDTEGPTDKEKEHYAVLTTLCGVGCIMEAANVSTGLILCVIEKEGQKSK